MTKKFLLSVAASALLSTSAFAGTIALGNVHSTLSTESYMQNGLDEHNFANFKYTFTTTRDSGSISDPLVSIDVTNLEFEFDDYDEDGKGTLPLSLPTEDETKTKLEGIFKGTFLIDMATGSASGLPFEEINIENGKVYLDFDGSSGNELKNGHTYVISSNDTNVTAVDVSYKFQATPTFGANPTLASNGKISLKAYSQTLDTNFVDSAEESFVPTLVNQFKVSCVRKFDGLINFENDRTSFVNPEHGERAGDTDTNTSTDTMINNDRMIFTLSNARHADANATRWMSGASTEVSFNASNSDNAVNFSAAAVDANLEIFAEAEKNNYDTKVAATSVTGGTFAYTAQKFLITYPNEAIKPGLTTFEVNLPMAATVANPLRPVKFTSPAVDLEQGLLVADEVRSDIVESPDAAGTFVLNDEDNRIQGLYPHIAPQIASDANMTDAGEWMDHAFIAQIPGATQTATTQTKLFIVNRSCVPVTPKFRLIKDGVVTEVNGAEIPVDTQSKTTLASIVPAEGQYAVEIIIPGVAEDFYVYAQAQGVVDKTITKDLPVYNTSTRD